MKAYLLVYSNGLGTVEQVKECLDSIHGLQWRKELPNSFYLLSERSALEISRLIRKCRPGTAAFLVSEITPNKNGWLVRDSWDFINQKRKP